MNTKLRIALHKQMHMVGHDFEFQYLCLMFLADLKNDLLQSFRYAFNEYLASILRTPHHMILARVVDVPIRFVCSCTHENSIQYEAVYCQISTLPCLPRHLKRNAPSIPRANATGFYGAV